MAIKIENHCCDCAVPGYPCRGSACPSRRVEVHYYDRCNNPIDDEYEPIHEGDNGTELCEFCWDELYETEEE